MSSTIYPGTGTTTYAAGGHRGTITGSSSQGFVFVRLDETGAMWAVRTGHAVAACTCGRPDARLPGHHEHCDLTSGRKGHLEVLAAEEIDRDTFDHITGLADLRRDMGWARWSA